MEARGFQKTHVYLTAQQFVVRHLCKETPKSTKTPKFMATLKFTVRLKFAEMPKYLDMHKYTVELMFMVMPSLNKKMIFNGLWALDLKVGH